MSETSLISRKNRKTEAEIDRALALIECELDCQRVVEHIAELAGCLEGSDEERRLALFVASLERWEIKRAEYVG